jgi:hypothetical protein
MSGKEKQLKGKRTKSNLLSENTEIETKSAIETLLQKKKKPKKKGENQAILIWTNKGSLLKLSEILFNKGFLIEKNDFLMLFQNKISPIKVKWNPCNKYHLAYLFHRLYKKKYIIILGNKGYFRFAEDHFIDFDGSIFKQNSLKKIRLKMVKEKAKFSFICKEVDKIIEGISLVDD